MGRRWPPPADAGDLFRFEDVLGVVDLGELAVAGVDGVLPVMSPLEFPRILLDVFGVVALDGGVVVDAPDGVELVEFVDDPGGPPVLLLLFRGGGAFLLLWLLLLSDLPFLDLLLVRFSATRSFRTHSSYLRKNKS